ncbi:IucA/IucC family protein [Legionella shakespearei]|uniref:FrgA protein n=1 Tax=Legionella shakespearei DSM 23087 TaxID=1122169 RepID=A0A0W0YRJ2_9GAMM|nr:IucA/IucC family protein [Legionella shakespearei]KTD59155.1 FrgA protein [Legionella shakespearei DSM 23087]
MALAYGSFHELSHQLRFLLFEIGIGLPQNAIDYFITLAHKETLRRLQHAALSEGLINAPIASHHVHDFIDQLQLKLKKSMPASQFFQWETIRNELDESIANEALAQAYRQCWNNQLANEASPYQSLWSWIKNKLSTHQSLLFLEQWGASGHHYHPSFQAKTGFTRREVLQNSPEFQAKISIHWCALKKDKTCSTADSMLFNTVIAREFPYEYALWQDKLRCNHLSPQDYYPVPVHPWQWRNQLQNLCAEMIDDKSLVLLPHHQTLIPSMSLDTLLSERNPNCCMQLATSVNTPYVKGTQLTDFQPQKAEISNWIEAVLTAENHYGNTLFITRELGNIRLFDQSLPQYQANKFSACLKQNPVQLLAANQKAVPLNSLLMTSPLTKTTLLHEIIKESTLEPLNYFSLYCQNILFSQMHLLLKYGITLNAQLHNTLIVFTDDKPQGLIINNSDFIKIADHPLYKEIARPGSLASSSVNISDLNAIRTLFIQSTLQNNISSLIDSVSHEFQLSVQELWNEVRSVLLSVFEALPKDIDPRLLSWQKHFLLQETWPHLCSFTMRLRSNHAQNVYIKQDNPLYGSNL